jgi:glycolate oxidase
MASNASNEFATISEIIRAARMNLTQGAWDYMAGASESETTMKRNRRALDRLALKPRAMRDVRKIDTSATVMGMKLRMPVLLAPIGSLETFCPSEGAAASARAAEEFGVCHMLSSRCSPGLEEVAASADNYKIFQLYVRGDASFEDDFARRAIKAGYNAFAVTIDTAVYSRRERDFANRFVKKWRVDVSDNEQSWQAMYTWDNVKRFKDTHDIPLIMKGIATAEDAALCIEHGVDGIYVSNHGGRQLDHGRGSMDVLPEVVEVAKGKATIIVDGGCLRGTDIIKARALGADLVGIGRLQCCGLAAGGKGGLLRALEILEDELRIGMGLCGATSWDDIDPSCVLPSTAVQYPSVFSAHHLLALDPHQY